MADAVDRELWAKYRANNRRTIRKGKLRRQFAGRYDEEAKRTTEKLWLLCELICEERRAKKRVALCHDSDTGK